MYLFCFLILAMLRKTGKYELTFYKYDYFTNFVYTPVECEGLFFFFLMSHLWLMISVHLVNYSYD